MEVWCSLFFVSSFCFLTAITFLTSSVSNLVEWAELWCSTPDHVHALRWHQVQWYSASVRLDNVLQQYLLWMSQECSTKPSCHIHKPVPHHLVWPASLKWGRSFQHPIILSPSPSFSAFWTQSSIGDTALVVLHTISGVIDVSSGAGKSCFHHC